MAGRELFGREQHQHQAPPPPPPHHQQQQSLTRQVAAAATAVTAGGSLLVLSGLTLAGTVIGLALATPLLVIFSPVLVPALITLFLLASGFLASGGFGVAALSVLSWIYRYATGKSPPGAEQLDQARQKLGYKAREMKDRAEHQVAAAATATAVTAGGSLLVLSCLTLAGTVIGLALATPLLVIFSPVLVPALITLFLLASGFLASGGFGVAALCVLSWIYSYATGKSPPGAEQLDQARQKLGYKAREMKERAEHQVTSS